MKTLSLLLKPASSLCNMRCSYCFYADVAGSRETAAYGLMTRDTARRILASAAGDLSPGDGLTLAFQGGEPTLAGLDFFRDFFAMADELLPGVRLSVCFQTNGLVLDDEWCAFLKQRGALVGLSMDGSAQSHNACRPDTAGKGTYSRVHASMERLKRHGVPFNILNVLTDSMARHPAAVWNWLKKEGVEYVQFIPCLAGLDGEAPSPWALTPGRFRDFYRQLFPLWARHLEQGHFLSVKLFDDLINLYLGGQATACGITGRCSVQYIVEADGDVFPCDFYALDRYRMGSLLDSTPSQLYARGEPFLDDGREYARQEPCLSCPYRRSCAGGCKRLRDSMYLEGGICRYAQLLDEILEPLLTLARGYLAAR